MTAQISRRFKRHLTKNDRTAKAIIEACVASGAGIDFLPEAPRFRYAPAERTNNPYEGRKEEPPSGRGSIPCGKGNPLKLKNWGPSRLDANPMHKCPMAGDSRELTNARCSWAKGDPRPLRKYLTEKAAEKALRDELFDCAA